ncbi:hypothetical protein [Catenulispora pinisilvae]|uniref:hypothetical protein n=1 Tax=Catenulispora pinisilvae TaxID=2705253 RepID=UPI0018922BD7|nr:hypothetical protein [Catenulispora pinisilvae]
MSQQQASPQASLDRVLHKLDRAVRVGYLVRISRSFRDADKIDGFVIGATEAWTLLASCADFDLDGFVAIRTADISRVQRRGDDKSMTVRVLRRRGQWPVQRPIGGVHLDGLSDVVTAAAEGYGFVIVHVEGWEPDSCWIGTVVGLGRKKLRLHEVDPEARWHDEPTKFSMKAITQIGFGDRYSTTLREFAGSPR